MHKQELPTGVIHLRRLKGPALEFSHSDMLQTAQKALEFGYQIGVANVKTGRVLARPGATDQDLKETLSASPDAKPFYQVPDQFIVFDVIESDKMLAELTRHILAAGYGAMDFEATEIGVRVYAKVWEGIDLSEVRSFSCDLPLSRAQRGASHLAQLFQELQISVRVPGDLITLETISDAFGLPRFDMRGESVVYNLDFSGLAPEGQNEARTEFGSNPNGTARFSMLDGTAGHMPQTTEIMNACNDEWMVSELASLHEPVSKADLPHVAHRIVRLSVDGSRRQDVANKAALPKARVTKRVLDRVNDRRNAAAAAAEAIGLTTEADILDGIVERQRKVRTARNTSAWSCSTTLAKAAGVEVIDGCGDDEKPPSDSNELRD